MKGELREILGDICIVALALPIAGIFISIKILGPYWAGEATEWILWVEIILPLLIAALGVERFIDDCKSQRKIRKGKKR